MARRWLAVAASAAALVVAPMAWSQQQAQPQQQPQAQPGQPPRNMPPPPRLVAPAGQPPRGQMPPPGQMPPRGQLAHPRPPTGPVAPHPLHMTEGGEGESEHSAHDAAPKPINWWHGFIGKKEGVEPSLLWRTPEEDAPFLAALLNFAVFAWVIYHFGKKPVQEYSSRTWTAPRKRRCSTCARCSRSCCSQRTRLRCSARPRSGCRCVRMRRS